MPIVVACGECSKKYRLSDELRGKKFKCKQCGAIVPIQRAKKSASSGTLSRSDRPTRRRRKTVASSDSSHRTAEEVAKRKKAAERRKAKQAEELQDDYGADDMFGGSFSDADYAESEHYAALPPTARRKKKKKKRSSEQQTAAASSVGERLPPMTFNPNRLNMGAVVLGGILMFFGGQEFRLAMKAKTEPKEITLAELETNGPGGDVYLTVSGVMPADDGYVAEEDRYKNMSKVWIPCASADSMERSKFLLYSTEARTEDAVFSLMVSGTHTGMIINDITGLGQEEKKLLRSSGLSPDEAYIFEVGRKPSGYLKCAAMLIGGLLLVGVGIAWMLFVHD